MPNAKKYKSIKNNSERHNHYKKQKREWMRNHRRRKVFKTVSGRLNNGCNGRMKNKNPLITVTPFDLWKIAKKQKLICPFTGQRLTRDTMSIDHIHPISRGGTNDLTNLQFVHKDINIAKASLTSENFIRLCNLVTNNFIQSDY